jgi:hypothetical protein
MRLTPFVVLLTLAGATVAAAAPSPEEIDQAARQLGDVDPPVGKRAPSVLKLAGTAAEKSLSAIAESSTT